MARVVETDWKVFGIIAFLLTFADMSLKSFELHNVRWIERTHSMHNFLCLCSKISSYVLHFLYFLYWFLCSLFWVIFYFIFRQMTIINFVDIPVVLLSKLLLIAPTLIQAWVQIMILIVVWVLIWVLIINSLIILLIVYILIISSLIMLLIVWVLIMISLIILLIIISLIILIGIIVGISIIVTVLIILVVVILAIIWVGISVGVDIILVGIIRTLIWRISRILRHEISSFVRVCIYYILIKK